MLLLVMITEEGQMTFRTLISKVTIFAAFKAHNFIETLETFASMIHSTASGIHKIAICAVVTMECRLVVALQLSFAHFGRHLGAGADLMPGLTAKVTGNNDFLAKLGIVFGRCRQFEPWMSVGAGRTRGAKAGKVVEAKNSSDVAMATRWAVATEAAIVPRAVFDLALGVDV